jgi:hypothetical protein
VPRGRLVEIAGRVSSGKTSLVYSLVANTLKEEGAAWVDPWSAFYAPAALRAGIPLDRLLLVRPPQLHETFRAGDSLIRSGALALVVIDAVGLPGRGASAPLFRFGRLAEQTQTTVVMITDHDDRVSSLGSAVALRLRIDRRAYFFEPEPRPPFDVTGYRIEVEVGKSRFRSSALGEGASVRVHHADGVSEL